MPSPDQILAGLQHLSEEYRLLAILWHVFFGAGIVSFILGFSFSARVAGGLLSLPAFSVGIMAAVTGNPFNALMFGALAVALAVIAFRLPSRRVQPERSFLFSGIAIMLFGWVYPHFQTGNGVWHYIATAPLGLVPCPTLSMLIGVTLVLGGFASRSWMRVLSTAGILYGAFGTFRLGVTVDLVLLAAALLLLLLSFRASPERDAVTRADAGK